MIIRLSKILSDEANEEIRKATSAVKKGFKDLSSAAKETIADIKNDEQKDTTYDQYDRKCCSYVSENDIDIDVNHLSDLPEGTPVVINYNFYITNSKDITIRTNSFEEEMDFDDDDEEFEDDEI